MAEGTITPLAMMLLLAAAGLAPFFIVTMTAFLKISVVMFIVRNALGIQQAPPNIVLYSISLILTVYVMSPVIADVRGRLDAEPISLETLQGFTDAIEVVKQPIKEHLARFAEPRQRAFFMSATEAIWPEAAREDMTDEDIVILLPAFVASELTRAFEIGFLLYLPFLVIDIVVSNVLMAMGMLVVQPTLISIPLKLLLFVSIDGWTRLMHGLVLSYG